MAAFSWRFIEKPILRMRRRWSVSAQIHIAPEEAKAPAPQVATA